MGAGVFFWGGAESPRRSSGSGRERRPAGSPGDGEDGTRAVLPHGRGGEGRAVVGGPDPGGDGPGEGGAAEGVRDVRTSSGLVRVRLVLLGGFRVLAEVASSPVAPGCLVAEVGAEAETDPSGGRQHPRVPRGPALVEGGGVGGVVVGGEVVGVLLQDDFNLDFLTDLHLERNPVGRVAAGAQLEVEGERHTPFEPADGDRELRAGRVPDEEDLPVVGGLSLRLRRLGSHPQEGHPGGGGGEGRGLGAGEPFGPLLGVGVCLGLGLAGLGEPLRPVWVVGVLLEETLPNLDPFLQVGELIVAPGHVVLENLGVRVETEGRLEEDKRLLVLLRLEQLHAVLIGRLGRGGQDGGVGGNEAAGGGRDRGAQRVEEKDEDADDESSQHGRSPLYSGEKN